LTCKPTNKIKVGREQHYIALSRVLSNKLPLQMSTQNYIRLPQLNANKKLVKFVTFTNSEMVSNKFSIYAIQPSTISYCTAAHRGRTLGYYSSQTKSAQKRQLFGEYCMTNSGLKTTLSIQLALIYNDF